ncbi:hypothetical protein EDC04DRAFT_2017345 [Pisolithus marmoratus]|nr:hypothetical protein EDC04DRAFT_2017345 [Pisolithus marmoratus]
MFHSGLVSPVMPYTRTHQSRHANCPAAHGVLVLTGRCSPAYVLEIHILNDLYQRPHVNTTTVAHQSHTKIYIRRIQLGPSHVWRLPVPTLLLHPAFQIYCMITLQNLFLVTGHHSVPGNMPGFPWQGTANTVQMFSIPFVVQCFYGWRLWIISDRNVLLVASVILLSAAECVSSVAFIFGLELPAFALRAAFSATGVIADVLITGSVYYYLRPSRFGMRSAQTAFQHVVTVTINMGALTSIIALWLWITWLTQGPIPPVATPLMITSQSYVNSILAVLNARAQEPQNSCSPDKPHTFGLMSLSIPEYLRSRRKRSVCPSDAIECAGVA